MESPLGEGGARLMCSVGKDVMGMDLFGNPDGRRIVHSDVPIADHGTHLLHVALLQLTGTVPWECNPADAFRPAMMIG